MTLVSIVVEVEGEHADPEHSTGLTNAAYERLTGYPLPLAWLGEIVDVVRAKDE